MENTLENNKLQLIHRPRRVRQSSALRELTEETFFLPRHIVAPLFVVEGKQLEVPIPSLPGISRLSIDLLLKEVEQLTSLGIKAIDLFAFIPKELRDRTGSESIRQGNLLQQAIEAVKKQFPELCVMVDIALDPYTDHGHDGIIDHTGTVLNDATVEALIKMSLAAAKAGADVIAPSDMMDGRVGAIRKSLDKEGFEDVAILAYTAKYASALYGPFRDALESAPRFGNKKGYQMCPSNRREALLEAKLDEEEGADILLVKPALTYLDVIAEIRRNSLLPIAAYHVSGEYAMVMAAEKLGWLNAERVFLEQLLSIRRAGADFILTYTAKKVLTSLAALR